MKKQSRMNNFEIFINMKEMCKDAVEVLVWANLSIIICKYNASHLFLSSQTQIFCRYLESKRYSTYSFVLFIAGCQ